MKRLVRRAAVAGCALGMASRAVAQGLPAPAGSEAGAPRAAAVRLVAPPCAGVPFERVRLVELLRVELRPLGVTEVVTVDDPGAGALPALDESTAAAVLVGPFSCDETREVVLTVADRATHKTVTRRLGIADVDPPGRPRVIAIAISELLSASWVEFALAPTAPGPGGVPETAQRELATRMVPAVTARSSAPLVPAPVLRPAVGVPPREPPRWGIEGSVLTRAFPARSTALLGGAAGVSYALASPLRLRLQAELAFGEADVSAGSIAMGAATGSLGLGISTEGPVQLEVEPHLVLGAGWATGTPAEDSAAKARSYSSVLGAAAVTGILRAHAGRFAPFAAVELGHTFASLSFMVDDARGAGFGSVLFGARVGASWGF